jgi:hypothetical protein
MKCSLHRLMFGTVCYLVCFPLLSTAQTPITSGVPPVFLQITSPASGSIVNPGQVASVSVTSPSNVSFAKVVVIGEDPIGFSSIQTGVPAQFALTIPNSISCGTYMLTALGITSSGQSVSSNQVLIDVERPDMPVSISASITGITLGSPGESFPIKFLGTFADGSVLDLTESSKIAYSVSNSSVATIDANGIVAAVTPGLTSVRAAYTQGGQRIATAVSVNVQPPALTPTSYSLTYGRQNVNTSSSAQQVTLTNAAHGPIRVISVNATGDFSESDNCTASSPLAAGGTCTVNIVFTPKAVGSRVGQLKIINSFSISTLSIPLAGTGM